jgi:peptidoglycan-associated lipoprotein
LVHSCKNSAALKKTLIEVRAALFLQNRTLGSLKKIGSIMMFQRILAIVAATLLLAACETASEVGGDSASTSSTSSASSASSSAAAAKTEADKLAEVGNTVYFDFDSSELSDNAQMTLNRQAAFLNVNPTLVIVIEGHADERGTREYNLALAARRATAVRDHLLAKGLNSARVRTVSYGKERPAVEGSTESAWEKNRRAATVLN